MLRAVTGLVVGRIKRIEMNVANWREGDYIRKGTAN
jgi:hypothetical protein